MLVAGFTGAGIAVLVTGFTGAGIAVLVTGFTGAGIAVLVTGFTGAGIAVLVAGLLGVAILASVDGLTISGTAGRVSAVLGRESVPPTAGTGNPFTGNGAVTVVGALVSA